MKEIKVGDKYNNCAGEPVRIVCVDMKDTRYPVVGIRYSINNDCEVVETYTRKGTYSHSNPGTNQDLVLDPWADFVEGEPVMVKNRCNQWWEKCYYSGKTTRLGEPLCWDSGKTKWSSNGSTAAWEEMRKPKAEELT